MHDPMKTKNFTAEAAIAARLLCVAGTAAGKALKASDSTKMFLGVSDELGADNANDRVDIHTHGFADVVYGGAVTAGDPITSDANGKAIKAEFVAGAVVYVAGFAIDTGVLNDIGSIRIAPCALANESVMLVADKTLTTGQVLALNATPIEVIAAPASGKAIVVAMAQAMLDYATTAYDGIAAGEDLVLRYTDGSGAIQATFETTGFLDQAADQARVAYPMATGATNLTPINAALVAHMATGEIATGDSPVKLRVFYRLVDLAL